MGRMPLLWAVAVACLVAAGCTSLEVEKVLTITDVSTGWYDAGIMDDGKNKLVPAISLHLKDTAGQGISGVQLNAIFRRVNEPEAWGEHFVKAIGQDGLAPGATSGPIVLRSNLGYTGEQPRQVMLRHESFIDAKVEIFAKHGRRTWVKMGEYQIARELLTR